MRWMPTPIGSGFYYWRAPDMNKNHVIVVQVAECKYPEIAPGKFHVGMLVPTTGLGYYDYCYDGRIEDMPKGKFWGPLPIPKD